MSGQETEISYQDKIHNEFTLMEYQSDVYGATFYSGLGGISWYEIQTPGFDSFELESFDDMWVSGSCVIADRGPLTLSDQFVVIDVQYIRELCRVLDVDMLWILNHLHYSYKSDLGGVYLPILTEGVVAIDVKGWTDEIEEVFSSAKFEVEDRSNIVNVNENDPAVIRGKVWGGSN